MSYLIQDFIIPYSITGFRNILKGTRVYSFFVGKIISERKSGTTR